jgi:hypothetical protein
MKSSLPGVFNHFISQEKSFLILRFELTKGLLLTDFLLPRLDSKIGLAQGNYLF